MKFDKLRSIDVNEEKAILVGITGGSGSGKSTIVDLVAKTLGEDKVCVISQDSYYKDQSHLPEKDRFEVNYDHPDAFDMDLFLRQIRAICEGKAIEVPIFDYTPCSRSSVTLTQEPKNVIIVDGILLLNDERIRDLIDLMVFIDLDADLRLARRILRDMAREEPMELKEVLKMYQTNVKPMHELFIEPNRKFADLVVPNMVDCTSGAEVIAGYIRTKL